MNRSADKKSSDAQERWRAFFDATANREPRQILLEALAHLPRDSNGRAVDLGCGSGHDTLAMLRHGLHVLAVDAQAEAIERTRQLVNQAERDLADRLETRLSAFEDLTLAPESFDLVYGGFSLPFCAPESFEDFWKSITRTVAPSGGVLAGQLFGDRDQWAGEPGHTARVFLPRIDIDSRFAEFEHIHFEEVERDGVTATGGEKHWHVYHFVLRRRR